MKTPTFVLISVLFMSACHSSSTDPRIPGKDTLLVDVSHPDLPPPKHNPEFRVQVKKEAVAEYQEKTGRLEGEFAIKLYQTSKTMAFRVDIEYEGLPGTDTIRFPDLGTEPHPVLQKGADKYSCVIGFLDNESKFRELKLVHAKGQELKITTLRHWVVTDHYRLVSQ
ncbi:MAG TPA: hypothetical protein VNV35_12375 [Puia sp.]|jgi:hypothetical protein|nr:hypothetical protein [Puia sp.]